MKINRDSFTLKLIQLNFKEKYPKDLCSFFWKGLASWISFLVAPWVHLSEIIFLKVDETKLNRYVNGPPWWSKIIFLGPLSWLFGMFFMVKVLPLMATPFTGYLLGVPLFILSLTAVIAVIVYACLGIGALREYLLDKYKTTKPYKEPKENWIVAWFKQYKEKHCRFIEYK